MGDNELGIVGIHRQRAAYDDFARQVARLIQHVLNSGPVHGNLLQLLLAARVAEYHLMSGSRKDRS